VTSKVTADCLVDLLQQWWQEVKDRFCHIQTLVINADDQKIIPVELNLCLD
jgi:hypothetical protein